MLALTVTQPYAHLVATRIKKFETRGWEPPRGLHGQLFAIHAATTLSGVGGKGAYHALCRKPQIRAALADAEQVQTGMVFGAIVAVVRLVEVGRVEMRGRVPSATLAFIGTRGEHREDLVSLGGRELLLGDYTEGRYAWHLDEVRAINPSPSCRGYQKLWTLPPAIEAQVRAQL